MVSVKVLLSLFQKEFEKALSLVSGSVCASEFDWAYE
jgi:hypothetical protein